MRDDRLGARGDHDVVGGMLLVIDHHAARAGQPGGPAEHVYAALLDDLAQRLLMCRPARRPDDDRQPARAPENARSTAP